LADRATYRMNISGTYEIAGTKYGFAVARNVTLPPPASGFNMLGTVAVGATKVTD